MELFKDDIAAGIVPTDNNGKSSIFNSCVWGCVVSYSVFYALSHSSEGHHTITRQSPFAKTSAEQIW